MRFSVSGSVTFLSVAALIACSSSTTSTGTGDGGSSSSSSSSSSGGSSSGGSSSGSSGKVAASTTAASVTLDKDCPAGFTACGGTLSGTYDYTDGCLGDIFADLRQQCPQLDTTGLKATVTGSIYFLANSALERDITSSVSGAIKFPATCALGSCTPVETALKDQFSNASCTLDSGTCTCTLSKTDHNTAGTTFTVSDKTVTTADGDKYDFCEQNGELSYSGKTKEAEAGTWHLKKR